MQSHVMLSQKTYRLLLFGLVFLFLPTLLVAGSGVSPVHAQTNTLTLSVVSARDEAEFPPNPCPPGVAPGVQPDFCGSWVGKPVTEYKYLINVDNTGDPGTGDPVIVPPHRPHPAASMVWAAPPCLPPTSHPYPPPDPT